MNKENKNIDLFSAAKQWFTSQSDKQIKLKREENLPQNKSKQYEMFVGQNGYNTFDDCNNLHKTTSVNIDMRHSELRLLPPKTSGSDRRSKRDPTASASLNIKSSKSVGCLQTSQISLGPKWVDISKKISDKKNENEKKGQDNSNCCPTCGQQWKANKPESATTESELKVAKWICDPLKDTEKKSKTPVLLHKNTQIFQLKRSSSLGPKIKSQILDTSRTNRVIKAASMMNDPLRSPWTQYDSKFKRMPSKEKAKSSPSFTHVLSYNHAISKNSKGDAGEDRSSMNSFKGQRSSCERVISYGETATSLGAEYEDIIRYSPKLTKETKFVNGCPLDGFKTIFDAESFRIPSIYGQLKIMFQLFNDTNEFQVTILEGSNVAVGKESGNIGIYTKICLTPGKVQKKASRNKRSTRNPVFYESFIFKTCLAQLLEHQLKIKLYNKPKILSIPKPIGQCIVPLYNYDLTAVNVIWKNLQKCKGQKDDMDEFDFSFIERDKVKTKKQFEKFLCGYSVQDE